MALLALGCLLFVQSMASPPPPCPPGTDPIAWNVLQQALLNAQQQLQQQQPMPMPMGGIVFDPALLQPFNAANGEGMAEPFKQAAWFDHVPVFLLRYAGLAFLLS